MEKPFSAAALLMPAFSILALAQTAQQTAPKVKVGTQLTLGDDNRPRRKRKEYRPKSQRGKRRYIGQGFTAIFVLDGRIGRR